MKNIVNIAIARNEYFIASSHPITDTIIRKLGKTNRIGNWAYAIIDYRGL